MTALKKLSDHAFNIYSQFGEDGIIEKIFQIIGTTSKICVEFGAWDGIYNANTANLWTKGWKGICIEANPEKYAQLLEHTKKHDCVAINQFVTPEGKHTLENIIGTLSINQRVDFLSIDIDGNDYYIFESLKNIKPRVIACEYNPTIPPHIELVAEKNNYFGCSALALVNLARTKGYELVAITDTNCFFVAKEEKEKFAGYDTELASIAITRYVTYLMSGYAGDWVISQTPCYGFQLPSQKQFIKGAAVAPRITLSLKDAVKILLKPALERLRALDAYQKFIPQKKNNAAKQNIIKEFRKKYSPDIFIETGTYRGDMLYALQHSFKMLYSIELDNYLFQKAKKRFVGSSNIILFQGDSGRELSVILKKINTSCLFWLDAHYSRGITAKGSLETPIVKELTAILDHPIKNHIILIDDARCFTGNNDYPTIEEIKKLVVKKNPILTVEVSEDIIRVYKK